MTIFDKCLRQLNVNIGRQNFCDSKHQRATKIKILTKTETLHTVGLWLCSVCCIHLNASHEIS